MKDVFIWIAALSIGIALITTALPILTAVAFILCTWWALGHIVPFMCRKRW
jgi:uncharacterized membrane protein YbaN (DUF454 family)